MTSVAISTGRVRGRWPATIWVGAVLCAAVVAVAFIGPYLAPHDPATIVGPPFARSPGLLGTDFNGRDILSRVLWGGRTLISLSVLATVLGYAAGTILGLVAAWSRGLAETVIMRTVDVLLGFPPLLFLLVVATGVGHSGVGLVLAVAVIQLPSIVRVVRAAALDQVHQAFVEAAVARGERVAAILWREVLPNIRRPLLADGGLRLTWSILLIAAVSFLGLGAQPPTANWALMIAENQSGLTLQVWSVLAPALLIAILTVSVNLVADGLARSDDARGSARR